MPWLDKDIEQKPPMTTYMGLDPAGAKPWFMLWCRIDAQGRIFVYREYPDEGYGEWGVPGELADEGKAGPAQKPNNYGIRDYVDLINNVEEGEDVFERIIDPRMGAARTPKAEGSTSIISELDDMGMPFIPAPAIHEDNGISLIKDKMAYKHGEPISALNSPKLFISDRCKNLIDALKNYTGKSRECAWKDPVDVLRYILVSGAEHINTSGTVNVGRSFSY
jgi:hypothetical protein